MGCMHYQTLVMYYDSTSEWVVVFAAYTSSAATTTTSASCYYNCYVVLDSSTGMAIWFGEVVVCQTGLTQFWP